MHRNVHFVQMHKQTFQLFIYSGSWLAPEKTKEVKWTEWSRKCFIMGVTNPSYSDTCCFCSSMTHNVKCKFVQRLFHLRWKKRKKQLVQLCDKIVAAYDAIVGEFGKSPSLWRPAQPNAIQNAGYKQSAFVQPSSLVSPWTAFKPLCLR